MGALMSLRAWPARRWIVAVLVAAIVVVAVAVPTDLIDTPWFQRDIPPTWWAWPSLAVSAALSGLLVASYVAVPASPTAAASGSASDRHVRGGAVAAVLTFFAVGCPVCNKLALLALGYAGAMTWFGPVQPVLQLIAIGLLVWALRARLVGALTCRAPGSGTSTRPTPLSAGSRDA